MTTFDSLDDGFSDNPLLPEESLGDDETGEDPDEGYSRLSHEVPEPGGEFPGDGIDGIQGANGELAGGQVGDLRAGRLVLGDADQLDSRSDYSASVVGIDGGAASAEEAAVHVVPDDEEG